MLDAVASSSWVDFVSVPLYWLSAGYTMLCPLQSSLPVSLADVIVLDSPFIHSQLAAMQALFSQQVRT